MLELKALSSLYTLRPLGEADVDAVLSLCRGNPQFYRYCGQETSRERIAEDMRLLPPGVAPEDKVYLGYYAGEELVAVLDLVDGYPDAHTAFIGFFMMNIRYQGQQRGTAIITELCQALKRHGHRAVRLGIDRDNPQSTHFWKKNGFVVLRAIEQDGGVLLLAEKSL